MGPRQKPAAEMKELIEYLPSTVNFCHLVMNYQFVSGKCLSLNNAH